MSTSRSAAWARAAAGSLLALLLAGSAPRDPTPTQPSPTQPPTREAPMSQIAKPLPMGIDEKHLDQATVFYAFYSAKAGAGRQEITISADGRVTLFLTRSATAPEEIRNGKLAPEIVIRLFDFMEGQDFMEMQDEYPTDKDPYATRVIKVTVGEKVKSVTLEKPGVLEFERCVGAIKLAAGVALPEALNKRFFPNL